MRTLLHAIVLAVVLGISPCARAALNGALYTVAAPIYDGSSGSTSYLRLFGGVTAASTFTINVVATATGATLGTAAITVPKMASPQLSFATVLGLARAGMAADHGYALYIQNPDRTAGYQHVTFNGTSGLFENSSSCATLLSQAVTAFYPSLIVTNVHTDRLAEGYPTQIDIHNYWNAPVTYGIHVYDAGTADTTTGAIRAGSGSPVGSTSYTIAANATLSLAFTKIQQDIRWTAGSSQLHANIIVSEIFDQPPTESVGVSIVNTKLGGVVNMAYACAVNAPPANPASGGGTGGAYLN